MNGKIKKIILGILLLVVLAVVYWLLSQSKTNDEPIEEPAQQHMLTDKSSENIVSAVISRSEDEITLINNSGSWILQGYEGLEFNQSSMSMLSNSLASLGGDDISGGELSEYGLDEPAATAEISFDDGTQASIKIGAAAPDGNYYYATNDDKSVYMISTDDAQRYFYTLNELVDKTLPVILDTKIMYVDIKQLNAEEIEIEYEDEKAGNAADLAAYGMQTLTMKKPLPGTAVYPNNIQSTLLSGMSSIALDSFIEYNPQDLAKYALDNPFIEITLRDTENELNLIVGGDAGNGMYYCMANDKNSVFTISSKHIAPFIDADITQFIERFVSLAYRIDVKNIQIKSDIGQYDINFIQENSTEATTEASEASSNAVNVKDSRTGYINGKRIDEDSFSDFYQMLVGITFDNISFTPLEVSGNAEVSIIYNMNDGTRKTVNYYPYADDKNFYVAEVDGQANYFVSRQTVSPVLTVLDGLANEKTD